MLGVRFFFFFLFLLWGFWVQASGLRVCMYEQGLTGLEGF